MAMYGRFTSVWCGSDSFDLGLFQPLPDVAGPLSRSSGSARSRWNFGNDVINDALVEVFTAQEGVTVGGQHFKLVVTNVGDFNDGNVEGATTQVVYGNLAVTFLLGQAKSQRSSGRFVDDALYFQAGNTAGILVA
jgi:hypothetical protein